MLFVCLGVGLLRAQTRQVTGVVTAAEDGLPVAGASILVKGSSQGTITDVEGRFVLSDVPASATTLVISFVGMKSCEVPVSDRVEVVLENEQQVLDEVLVTVAYGTAKRSSLTGAISSVDQKQIELRPTSSVTSALEGSTSGVQINSTYGAPGSTPDIRIRGIGTVNGSSSPLYVVDGVPFSGSIADINPADIESLSVLKDAASCALYGNRASNGVILITTKKGTAGRLSLDLKVNQGIYTRGIKEYARTDVRQFMEASWQNLRNARISAGDDPATAARYASDNLIGEQLYLNIFNKPDKELFDASGRLAEGVQVLPGYAEDLDWYKAAIRKGYRQEYVLSGNAASEKSDYYFSLGYLNEEGYVRNSAFDRLSARVSVNLSPVSWIKAGVNLSGSHQNSKITAGDQGASFTNAFMYCREIAPIYPVHLHNADGTYRLTADGKRQYDPGYYTDDKGVDIITRNQYADRHVVWENELDKNETVRNTLQSIAYMDVKFLKDFTFTVKGDMNLSQSDNSAYDNAVIGNGKGSGGRTNQTTYRYKSYTFQQQLKWTHLFGNHLLDVLLAHENFSYNYNYSYGFKSAQIFAGRPNYGNFTEITSLDGYEDNYRTESYLGRIRYNFRDRYNLEVSFRRDGSSRFHPDNRWGNFGSVGANWIISEEDFMKDVHWVNELKLRANYGQVGNDAGAGYYGYMSLYTIAQNAHKGALYLNQNDSYGLKWETGEAYGVAVETRLFDRWNLSVEYFDKRNKDLLFDIYLPLSAGATSTSYAEATVTRNLGTISNRGIEINTDVDVFGHYDGIVYHQSYRKHYRQHGQHIDGEPRHVHDKEGTDERDRNHDNRYQRDAPVAQKQEDDDDNQEESLVNGTLHFGNGGTDKAGIVESIRVRHIIGKVFFHLLHTFVHGIGYLDMIGSGLRDDHHAHHRHTVHLHVTLYVGSTQFGIPDIAQSDDLSTYLLNYDIVELVGGMHLSHGAQGQFYGISFDASRRKFYVLVVHRILYVNWSHTIARHLYGVEPQAHRIAFFTPYRHAAHIGYGLKLLFYGQVGYLAQF